MIARDAASILELAPFVRHLGIRLVRYADGECDTVMTIAPEHVQQDGFVHAGVVATIADHTAGGAAATAMAPGQTVLTIEYKINLLRPAVGDELQCKARVLRAGKSVTVAESEVFAAGKLVAKAMVTLAVVPTPVRTER